jgi:hypothetical protein
MNWDPNKCVLIDFGVLSTNTVHTIKYYGKVSRMRLPFLFFSHLPFIDFINRRHNGPHSFPLILTHWNS